MRRGRSGLYPPEGGVSRPESNFRDEIKKCNGLLTAAIGIQLVIVTLKFRLEVFIANPRFEDFDVSAGVCGGSSLPGTG